MSARSRSASPPRGREIRDECGCLGEELLARSRMTGEQLGKLNRMVQALRDAVADER